MILVVHQGSISWTTATYGIVYPLDPLLSSSKFFGFDILELSFVVNSTDKYAPIELL